MRLQKLVSIVIPAYNAENTIVETLESVLQQTYDHIEVIVVNDGSTDRTLEVAEQFVIGKPTIRVFTKGNEGAAATRNYGFKYVKGEFLLFLDSDDLLAPEYVSACISKFEEQPALDIVYTQTRFFERETELFVLPPFAMDTMLQTNCFAVTAMMRSNAFEDIGMYDTHLRFAEDWEMWIRMVQKYGNVYQIEMPFFLYRKRNTLDSLTDQNKIQNVSEDAHFYIYKKHYELYKRYSYGIENLFMRIRVNSKYRRKYNNIWYRKLFYAFFKRKNYSDN